MKSRTVRKNTAPYIQPYSVIDEEGNVLGNYNTLKKAEEAAEAMKTNKNIPETQGKAENAIDAIEKRMAKPDGDRVPKKMVRKVIVKND